MWHCKIPLIPSWCQRENGTWSWTPTWMHRDISHVYKNGGSPFWCLPGEDSECTAYWSSNACLCESRAQGVLNELNSSLEFLDKLNASLAQVWPLTLRSWGVLGSCFNWAAWVGDFLQWLLWMCIPNIKPATVHSREEDPLSVLCRCQLHSIQLLVLLLTDYATWDWLMGPHATW